MSRRIGVIVSGSFALLGLLLATPAPAAAAALTYTVNRIGDAADLNPGNGKCDSSSATGLQCTLRAAIQEANAHAGADSIKFAITSSSKVIKPASPLPPITERLTINGYSQTGASVNTLATGDNAKLKIVLNGANAGGSAPALTVQGNGSTIKGIVIQNFQHFAIDIGASNVTVAGNFIGTDAAGSAAAGNAFGVFVADSPSTTIGGNTPAARNIISGNSGDGINLIRSSNSTVEGNYIGTDASGANALGNAGGVNVADSTNVTIGGLTAAAGNVISANVHDGILTQGAGTGITIQANRIGTSATGSTDLGNGGNGISLLDAGAGIIGGTGQAGNAVLFNFNGITVDSSNNTISGNAVENNGFMGVFLSGGSSNTISGNVFIGNVSDGVFVEVGTGNLITANQMVSNGGLGIDLQGPAGGVTANDTKDPDTGPNGLQNFPVLASAFRASNGVTMVSGTLNSLPSTEFRIEFYVVLSADSSGHGEGFAFLGSTQPFTTTSLGNKSFTFATAQLVAGEQVTATAIQTANGNTSEFSANVLVIQH